MATFNDSSSNDSSSNNSSTTRVVIGGGQPPDQIQIGADRWYFNQDQLSCSPSRRCGIDADKELVYRQLTANLIQDMGQHLRVSQLCINTAIVYMHRFYVIHSFTVFHRNAMAAAALFLAAKLVDQPRKTEHVIKIANICVNQGDLRPCFDTRSKQYLDQVQDLLLNESILLQTLGFDLDIDHPHSHVVQFCNLVAIPKDIAKTSYFMASSTLHFTTMCIQYKPTVVACFCIYLACKWSNWSIPLSEEGKHWFYYVDQTVTNELLEQLTSKFLHIFNRPFLKDKTISIPSAQDANSSQQLACSSSNNFVGSKELQNMDIKQIDKTEADKNDVFGSSSSSDFNQNESFTRKINYREYKERQQQHDRRNPSNIAPSDVISRHTPEDTPGSSQFKNNPSDGHHSQTRPSSQFHHLSSDMDPSGVIPRYTPADASGSSQFKNNSSVGQRSQIRPSSQFRQLSSTLAPSDVIPGHIPADASRSSQFKNNSSNRQRSQTRPSSQFHQLSSNLAPSDVIPGHILADISGSSNEQRFHTQPSSHLNQPSSNYKSKTKIVSMRHHPYQSSLSSKPLSHPQHGSPILAHHLKFNRQFEIQ